ncbi:Conidiation protein 6-domain-containing protein [Talaromyces proteolyticus]|uniref:Conidiation protein 6-domain-containing protein n=1 Tax=Talaromyces proteolyticus TaxID=1131652 RepID=A0AAD4KI87_9EURO|nr:Conidiation protein 6-domain-containing protein [Talaromyces proteolyticus]KAH8689990.1 Conidiation protein 6-domain-containing protein [Talaromyces proteolyticus]
MPRSRSSSPNPANQERGYKAALHNPRVSQGAKQHAQEVLQNEFGETQTRAGSEDESFSKYGSQPVQSSRGEQKSRQNVVRGLKAATQNMSNSDEGRAHARSKLEDLGQSPDE